jgi:hypothetical protein
MTGRGDVTLDVIGCRQRRLTAPVAWGADGQAGHTGSDHQRAFPRAWRGN